MDAKPGAARPAPAGGLPKGAIGTVVGAPPPAAAGPSLKGSSAGSAFGAAKQTLLGAARPNANAPAIGTAAVDSKLQPMAADALDLELADLPAPAGSLPLVDLPAAKPASENAGFAPKPAKLRKKTRSHPTYRWSILPAAKAASPIGQPNMQKPANTIEPAEAPLELDALVDLPAPRPQPAGLSFGAKAPAAKALRRQSPPQSRRS